MPISDRQLTPWAHLMKRHLQEFRPKEYLALLQAGTLNDHIQGIVDRAEEEFNDLLNSGLQYDQAFEKIRDQIYPSPERW